MTNKVLMVPFLGPEYGGIPSAALCVPTNFPGATLRAARPMLSVHREFREQSHRLARLLGFPILNSKPHPRAPTVLGDESNSGLFQSLLHRMDGGARDVAARFFKIDNR